jgi:geranylgeranyl pyrophosphate synthase
MEIGHLTTKTSFAIPVQQDIEAVEKLMRAQADGRQVDLGAALDLLLSAGGKRVRPALTLLAGKMLGGSTERLITLAAAIELLHTATLVHDDLIDGSLLRRGMPTLNSQWTPGATVLTGDFLFACAAKLASDTNSIPVMGLFSHTLTVIVNGEITQLFTGRCRANREEYFRRIYAKTASLFETSAKSAGLISGTDEQKVEALRSFGYNIGMAFQIVDDILDFKGDPSTLGKPVGSDLRQGIITLPAICYIESNSGDPLCQQFMRGECETSDSKITQMINAIRNSSAISMALKEACQFVDQGLEALRTFPAGLERDSLQELATFFLNRDL